MKILLGILVILASLNGNAVTCETRGEWRDLILSKDTPTPLRKPVKVKFDLEGNNLIVNFEVKNPTLNAKLKFGPKEYPYHFDVVELFMVASDEQPYPYYEFQVSPYNQTLVVRIDRGPKFVNHVTTGFTSKAQITPSGWSAQMTIPLQNLNWKGDPAKLVGNAFAILERSPRRSFWSLSLPTLPKLNFHQPQYFQQLLKCR